MPIWKTEVKCETIKVVVIVEVKTKIETVVVMAVVMGIPKPISVTVVVILVEFTKFVDCVVNAMQISSARIKMRQKQTRNPNIQSNVKEHRVPTMW